MCWQISTIEAAQTKLPKKQHGFHIGISGFKLSTLLGHLVHFNYIWGHFINALSLFWGLMDCIAGHYRATQSITETISPQNRDKLFHENINVLFMGKLCEIKAEASSAYGIAEPHKVMITITTFNEVIKSHSRNNGHL